MSLSLMDLFKIMDILVNFYDYENILENFKVNIDFYKIRTKY